MKSAQFIPLRLHTEFSITDGMVRIKEAVVRTKEQGLPALGISDLMNLFGMVKFYKACRSEGIKPIIGVDVLIKNEADLKHPSRLMLIAKNHAGYLRLCELLSRAYLQESNRGHAELEFSWLKESANSDLICLSGAHLGSVGHALLDGKSDDALSLAKELAVLFPKQFYLELQRLPARNDMERCVSGSLEIAAKLKLPIVATHPIQFLNEDDFEAHEARVCIAGGYVLGDTRRPKDFEPEQYFIDSETFVARFADLPEALENSLEIAKRCSVNITLGKNYLPDFPTPDNMSLDDFLIQEAQRGLTERLSIIFPDETIQKAQRPLFEARLKFETDTIIDMGFPGYFLIVADFIRWAKHNNCPVGPGRGSGAGSLVAFALGITDVNPLDYALLFERFLNPERVSMPDFDVDFCQDNRGRVIDYVRTRYGHEAVSQIITFGTLASKAVVRDVGRVLEMPYGLCDFLSKLIPAAPGKQYSLDDAVQMEPQLKEKLETDEEVGKLWGLAKKLEGLTRNVGMHAGGVLIAPGKITDFCPIYKADGGVSVSQYDKDDVEQIGLVKFDFLGLRNLTIIELAIQYIKTLHPDFSTNLYTLPFTDPAAYKILQKANTTAVFQLESDGMKRLLEKLKPDRFEDIIAVLALYRPGPLGSGMVDDFILRKAGKQKVDYFHPDLTACLEPTYGVIVYQEQVMQISQIIGNYTLGGADMLRRAMGKKNTAEMAKHRSLFTEGAIKKGYNAKLAEHLFDLMAKFAEYGFNKSHTAAYAVVAYQTAWLKAHYPAEFIAATMSSELDNTDQLKVFYDDALANQIIFLPPCVNHSIYRFMPAGGKNIRYALGAIKGTGESAVDAIVTARESAGPFTSLFDFCERVSKSAVNKRSLEALVRAGAFDTIEPNRAKLFANIPLAIENAEQLIINANQDNLFDFDLGDIGSIAMLEAEFWNDIIQLKEEKQALGFYFSSHPFAAFAKEVQAFIKQPLSKIFPKDGTQIMAGFATNVRTKMGQRGKMVFITLEDNTHKREVSVFGKTVEEYASALKSDQILVIEARVIKDEYSGSVGIKAIADKVYTLDQARTRFARGLMLKLQPHHNAKIIHDLLKPQQGKDSVISLKLSYKNQLAYGELKPNNQWRVTLTMETLSTLEKELGKGSIEILW